MNRIVLCYPVGQRHIQRIAAAAPGSDVVAAGQERIAEELLSADLFCGHPKVRVPWDQIVQQGRLRWIQSSAAGVDHCLVPSVIQSDIVVTSASGVLADQVAEHTIALITATLRRLPDFFRAQAARQFDRQPTRDLHNATVGIVGLGGVGRRLSELLAAFKTRLIATDVFPVDRPAHVEALWPPEHLDLLLTQSDIVVLCAPLTGTTRGMIDAGALAKMKKSAIIVNVARGELVVEADLIAALQDNQLSAAALDVTQQEPLSPNSRLWEMQNVIITPHVAGQSARRIDQMTDFFCENLARYQRSQPLMNLVDKQLGFPVRR